MNKDKRLFKNNVQKVIYLIVFFLLIGAFIYLGRQNFSKKAPDDHEKFNTDYSLVDGNNVFEYSNSSKVRLIVRQGEGIIFFGTNKSNWANYYAKILNDVALSVGIEKIYYYDFIEDRTNHNGTYESIVELLTNSVLKDDLGKKNIYAPTLVIIKDGKVILYDDETSFMRASVTPENYWTNEKIEAKKTELMNSFFKYLGVEN